MSGVPNVPEHERSLPEVFQSVKTVTKGTWLRRFLGFAGPGYLVSVGYMDPGNWATDLAGGSEFAYKLLWVILLSNLMAMLLQSLCVRLGLVTGKDLAQACRDFYKKPAAFALWILCEIAIIACDLAEVIGSAVALKLLFGIPLIWGVLITAADVLLLLALTRFGFRKLEAVVITLVATIAFCFLYQIYLAKPDMAAVGMGLVAPTIPNKEALIIAVGILGATVMPHNLYLHSSIVQTRAFERTTEGLKSAIKFATTDVIIALAAAFFVNAAILILAASVFHSQGIRVEELEQAYQLLIPALGGAAATAFAVALLASGQSSTITGTLAGQIVMEGFLKIRVKPWIRRLVTRLIAIVPAVWLISASGGKDTVHLLTLSQVVLSMQLSFAIFPLLMFTADKKRMGEFVNKPIWTAVGLIVCLLIAALNVKLLYEVAADADKLWAFFGGLGAMAAFAVWVTWFYKEKPSETLQKAV